MKRINWLRIATVAVSSVSWTAVAAGEAVLAKAANGEADEKACATAKGDACARIAQKAAQDHDMPRYRTFIDKACAAKHGPSCGERAQLAPTMAEVAAFHKRGCELGYQPSCGDHGQILVFGNGVKKDTKAGIRILGKACKANDGPSCHTLALFTEGPRKIALEVKACELSRSMNACFIAGDAYLKGEGVKADPVRAKKLFAHACSPTVPSACHKAGVPVPPMPSSKP